MLAQKLGQLQPFYRCIPAGMHGPTCIFWANLTPFSLKRFMNTSRKNAPLAKALGPPGDRHGFA